MSEPGTQSNTSSDTLTIPKPALANLFKALAEAQGEFPVIPKDSEVEVKKDGKLLYKYKYADLTTIIDCTRPALFKYHISFTQNYDKVNGGFYTNLQHASGEQMRTGFVQCKIADGLDMKIVAGLYTYGKRISLTAALGVSADEDMDSGPNESIDGNSTNKKPKEPPQKLPGKPPAPANHAPGAPNPPPPFKLSDAQIKRMYALGQQNSWPARSVRLICMNKLKITPGQMSKTQYDNLCAYLEGSPYDDAQVAYIENIELSLTPEQLALIEK